MNDGIYVKHCLSDRMVVQGLRKQKNVGETRTMISYETVEVL